MPLFHVTAEQGCSAIAVAIEADDRNDAINNFRDAHPLERNWKIKAVVAGERREAREQRLARLLDQAERFIAGFQGDPMQDVDELLDDIRDELRAN